jgi:hypothetical protein
MWHIILEGGGKGKGGGAKKLLLVIEPEGTESHSQRLTIILSQTTWDIPTCNYLPILLFNIISQYTRRFPNRLIHWLLCKWYFNLEFLKNCSVLVFSFNNSKSNGCSLYHHVEEFYNSLFRLLRQKDSQVGGLEELDLNIFGYEVCVLTLADYSV